MLLWITWLSRVRNGTTIVAGLFITGIVLQGLEPFYLARTPRPFGWIPFRSFMQGSMEIAVVSFLEKVFTYGSLVWLLTRTGFSWARATLSGAALIFAIRLAQVYLPGRSAEITDVIMLLIMDAIMRLMPDSGQQNPHLSQTMDLTNAQFSMLNSHPKREAAGRAGDFIE